MSEQLLKDFGARAETLVEIPDFSELDRRGHALRVRRRANVAAALTAVLAVAGLTVAQAHRTSADPAPVTPPRPPADARAYPDATMKTLDPGTYWLAPSVLPGHSLAEYADNPIVEFAVPKGWNAWVGPNRFDGHAPGRTNDEALGHLTWYVGALALQVTAVNTHGCDDPDVGKVTTRAALVDALTRTFGFEQIRTPHSVRRFGYPATRMRVRVTKAVAECGNNAAVFDSASSGPIQYAGVGWIADIWVVDVDGHPVYVQKIWTRNAPPAARAELDSVVDSIRFSYPR